MSLVSTVEKAVDMAVIALGDAITSVNRATISVGAHVPGSTPTRTAVFTKCNIAIVAMRVEDFPETQIESTDKSILDIRPSVQATNDDRYRIDGKYYRVMFAKNTFAGNKVVLQELVIRPSDDGGLTWA